MFLERDCQNGGERGRNQKEGVWKNQMSDTAFVRFGKILLEQERKKPAFFPGGERGKRLRTKAMGGERKTRRRVGEENLNTF